MANSNPSPLRDVLAEICDVKRQHVAAKKQQMPLQALEAEANAQPAARGFHQALKQKAEAKQIALIAEIKKASPSKGLIRADFDPVAIATSYQAAGATCLSILTDQPYFQGDDRYIAAVKQAVDLPILRKDFMLDPYQVIESRALGADCILLIMAALSNEQAKELEQVAFDYGLDVLIEVHNAEELARAEAHLRSPLMGVNNRNLKTLEINLSTSLSLKTLMSSERLPVCESGIYSHDDIMRMQQAGFACFLVGESLMREADIKAATERLLGKKK